jgi:hypothetical protein
MSVSNVCYVVVEIQGRFTMSELYDLTGFDRRSLTTIVDELIDRGFVKRERGEMNRWSILKEIFSVVHLRSVHQGVKELQLGENQRNNIAVCRLLK